MSNWARMLFFGDSLTYGSRDPYGLSWPYYLSHLALQENYTIIPELEAEPGCTSSQLVRIGLEKAMHSEAQEAFILIGTNDGKDEVNTPVSVYLANIRLLYNVCKSFGKRVYVLTVPIPGGFGSNSYTKDTAKRVEMYNESLRSAFPLIIECSDLRGAVDGIHFSVSMSEKVAERVWQAIKSVRNFT